MSVAALCVERPIGTSLLTVACAALGLLALLRLPVAALPDVDSPTIVVSTALPGASAETMAQTVTAPLERQLGQLPGLASISSVSGVAQAQIILRFRLDHSIDTAEQDVQAGINAAANLLPTTMPTPPTFSKTNPADTPVVTLAVRGDHVTTATINDFADTTVVQRLSRLTGVGLVTLSGGQRPAVRVTADPVMLASLGLTLADVRAAIAAANVNQPKGTIEGTAQSAIVAVDDQLETVERFRDAIVTSIDGAPLKLGDVAIVTLGVENEWLAGWADGDPAVIVNVQRQPGQNLIAVSERVHALLPSLSQQAPRGVSVALVSDRTETIRASLAEVQWTLWFSVLLVVVVVYAFLGSLRATAIPAVTVPLSMLTTTSAMWCLNYSLDNLSLMALTISVSFVVDDAIVMVENVARCQQLGLAPKQAAIRGAEQIVFTIVSLTVSLVAVLIPLLLMEGVVGRLFREFAVTLSIAILASGVLSITLTPMLCAQWLSAAQQSEDHHAPLLHRAVARAWQALTNGYARSLHWVMDRPRVTMASFALTVGLTFALAWFIPKGFFPVQDTGLLTATTEVSPEASFAHLCERQQAVAQAIAKDPAVAHVASFVGSDGLNSTSNQGRLSITLASDRKAADSLSTIIPRLLDATATLQGIRVDVEPVQDLQLEHQQSRHPYHVAFESADAAAMWQYVQRVHAALEQIPQLQHVAIEGGTLADGIMLRIDRETAARLGVSVQAIDDTLYDALGQRIVSTIFTERNQYRVVLTGDPRGHDAASWLDTLHVGGNDGPVPLSLLLSASRASLPLRVDREGQLPRATVSFDLAPGVSIGEAIAAVGQVQQQHPAPMHVRAALGGTALSFRESLASQPLLIAAAIACVYVVLGVLYESYLHPLTILSTLPSAGVGALLALSMAGMPLDILALIGLVLLVGIVKKNGIMMVDFAIAAEREQKRSARAAIEQAALLRFRPIMMTTLAALLGGLPLAFATGIGHELRRPLGVSIVGGLLVSQLLTLYTTPVIYCVLHRLSERVTRLGARPSVRPVS